MGIRRHPRCKHAPARDLFFERNDMRGRWVDGTAGHGLAEAACRKRFENAFPRPDSPAVQ